MIAAEPGHRVARRSDARQDDPRSGADCIGVGGYLSFGAEAFKRELQRGEIRAATVDDDGVHYNTPLVEGSSLLSRRNA